MYSRGDRVLVQGMGGKRATLVVWDERRSGLMLCTEKGFQGRIRGEDAPVVGYPYEDIMGLVDGEKEAQARGREYIAGSG